MAEGKSSDLAAKLDEDLANYISQLKPKKYEDGWPEDKWEEEMEKHPIFMSKPLKEGDEVPPLVEALQQLKYDPDTNSPEELAKSYKADGNQYFKVKKYRWAVESYTEGLKAKCEDQELNSQLYANRAAAQFYIGNYKKSLADCTEAKALNPTHLKAIRRGAQCCYKLKQYEDCIAWCKEGLNIDKFDSELQELRMKAEKQKLVADRDKRKAASKATHDAKDEEALRKAIKERGIQMKDSDSLNLSDLEPVAPALSECRVHFDKEGCLIWPVMLLYPEYGITDYIQAFHENSRLIDHFNEMFNDKNRPSWDKEDKYHPEKLLAYFGCPEGRIVAVSTEKSLKSILCHKKFRLYAGTPCFFVVVSGSAFEEFWLKNTLER